MEHARLRKHKYKTYESYISFTIKAYIGNMKFQGMRQTFFAQFVAGETAEGSFPLLERLHQRGCAAMLNWSAEADHAVVQHHPSPPGVSSEDSPKILKESFEELSHAIKASMNFHPEYDLRPTMLAIKRT